MMEFKECAECSAKPGSPTLCDSCLHNRSTINKLNNQQLNAEKTITGLVKKDDVVIAALIYDAEVKAPILYKIEKMDFDGVMDLISGGKMYATIPTKGV